MKSVRYRKRIDRIAACTEAFSCFFDRIRGTCDNGLSRAILIGRDNIPLDFSEYFFNILCVGGDACHFAGVVELN